MINRSFLVPSLLIVTGLCSTATTTAVAQDDRKPRIDARAMVAIPQGESAAHLNSGGGLGGSLMIPVRDKPIQLGFDVGIVSFSNPVASTPTTTSSSVMMGNLAFRFQSIEGTFRPYVDAFLGVNYQFSETRIPDGVSAQPGGIVSTSNLAPGYGVGAGIDITVFEEDSDFFLQNVEVTGGLRLLGSSLSYAPLLPGAGGGFSAAPVSSSLMLVPQLGITTKL
jgi:hypothetical protein